MGAIARRSRTLLAGMALSGLAVGAPACGTGGGAEGAGVALALLSFLQGGVDNLPLNAKFEFRFAAEVDPASIGPASIQIREGSQFGRSVPGRYLVLGAVVFFEPQLPSLCDLSDSGLRPDTSYRVQVVGHPEVFAVRDLRGRPLDRTQTFQFHTRSDTDPLLFQDQVPGASPRVVSSSIANGAAAVSVFQGNKILLTMSENILPCSVNDNTVILHEYQRGDPAVFDSSQTANPTGFTPPLDGDPSPFSWGPNVGGMTTVNPPWRVLSRLRVIQDFESTVIEITPNFGEFPDNALLVLQLSFQIRDFGGLPLVPFVISFTTENRPVQQGTYEMEFEGETPILVDETTARVGNGLAQGFLLFSGDGDNGGNLLLPTAPNVPPACTVPRQANDGVKDDFDPASDVNLDTGATANTCLNNTDGSTAVIWEFRSMRVRNGVIVRVVGMNPAIFLLQNGLVVEPNGIFRVRGDNQNGAPNSNGGVGVSVVQDVPGGIGVAGGGRGGRAWAANSANVVGEHGIAGFGSPQAGVVGGTGGGRGNTGVRGTTFQSMGSSGAGGGGGHSEAGLVGQAVFGNNYAPITTVDGAGGGTYPAMGSSMPTPEAGSGGGGAGQFTGTTFGSNYGGPGGGGGAGGGFVDITANASVQVYGIIDAAGGRGGDAGFRNYPFYFGMGGGGGGSGGGIRILTPFDIILTGGTLTTAGGIGGSGSTATNAPTGPANNGGPGGPGRIVLETGNSVVTGIGAAVIIPPEGSPGFFRGVFNAARFKGGGLEPTATTGLIGMGPASPTFIRPTQDYNAAVQDFLAGIPPVSSRGLLATAIRIEVRGYPMLADGNPDLAAGTGYYTIGYFRDSGASSLPQWVGGAQPPDVGAVPQGNVGAGHLDAIPQLQGKGFLQVRMTFFLPATVGPFDPGPFIDRWTIRFTYDQ